MAPCSPSSSSQARAAGPPTWRSLTEQLDQASQWTLACLRLLAPDTRGETEQLDQASQWTLACLHLLAPDARGEEAATSCPALEVQRSWCYSLRPRSHLDARFSIALGPSRQGRRLVPWFRLAPSLCCPPSIVRANSRKPNQRPKAGDSGRLLARARRWLPCSVAPGRRGCSSKTEVGAPLAEWWLRSVASG